VTPSVTAPGDTNVSDATDPRHYTFEGDETAPSREYFISTLPRDAPCPRTSPRYEKLDPRVASDTHSQDCQSEMVVRIAITNIAKYFQVEPLRCCVFTANINTKLHVVIKQNHCLRGLYQYEQLNPQY